MAYTFRIRLNRSYNTIATDLSEIVFPGLGDDVPLFLRAVTTGKSIREAEQWVLVGEGYESEREALEAGARFQDALMIAFTKMRVGVDFGYRSPKGIFTTFGLQSLEAQAQRKVLNNVHGLMAYPTDPPPLFVAMEMEGPCLGVNLEFFTREFVAATALSRGLTDRERLAFSLFNASFFQPTGESRFLLLVMAIETMINPLPKSHEAIQYVNGFREQIEASSLSPNERQSLIGSLEWMRDESINSAGKRLVRERLGDKTYGGKSAPRFFSEAYKMRSNLVHGNMPFPSFHEVGAMAALLEVFVSDLLTAITLS